MEWGLGLLLGIAVAAGFTWWSIRRRRAIPRIPDTADAFLAAADRAAEHSPGGLFGDAIGTPFPGPAARRWALGVLYEQGVDADADPAYAAGVLVRAEPRLGRSDADALIRALL